MRDNPLDRWLDADREKGVEVARVTAEAIEEAKQYRRGTWDAPVYVLNLLSQRCFEVVALRYVERNQDCYGALVVIRGCFHVLRVPLAMLEEGDTAPPRFPYRGAWPTRLFNPPRQNLSFAFEGEMAPCAVEIHWRHVGSSLDR